MVRPSEMDAIVSTGATDEGVDTEVKTVEKEAVTDGEPEIQVSERESTVYHGCDC